MARNCTGIARANKYCRARCVQKICLAQRSDRRPTFLSASKKSGPSARPLRGRKRKEMKGAAPLVPAVAQHVRVQPQSSPERVLNVLGEQSVERVRLMARQARETLSAAVGPRQAEDRLGHAQQSHVDRHAVMNQPLAV